MVKTIIISDENHEKIKRQVGFEGCRSINDVISKLLS